MKYHECSCDSCNRNTNNWNGRFKRYDNKWYCEKHYHQLNKFGKITDGKVYLIYNKGINDLSGIGWYKNKTNKRIYDVWRGFIRRCYDENFLKENPTYRGCYVCEKWLKLSGFLDDLPKIDGYEFWLNNPNKGIALDKDIKSNGKNKCYCLEECIFTTQTKNSIQSNKTMDYSFTKTNEWKNAKRKSAHTNGKVMAIDEKNNKVFIFNSTSSTKRFGFEPTHVSECCKGKRKTHKKLKWKLLE